MEYNLEFPATSISSVELVHYTILRVCPTALPTMPDAVTGVGAVAMPDGRVLICGGVIVEVKKGGVVSYTQYG